MIVAEDDRMIADVGGEAKKIIITSVLWRSFSRALPEGRIRLTDSE